MSDDESLDQIQSVQHKHLVAAQTTHNNKRNTIPIHNNNNNNNNDNNHELLLQNSSHGIPYCIISTLCRWMSLNNNNNNFLSSQSHYDTSSSFVDSKSSANETLNKRDGFNSSLGITNY